jgi:hypothetical protein
MKSARKLVALTAAGLLAAALASPSTSAWARNSNGGSNASDLPKLTLSVSDPDPVTGFPTATAAWVGNVKKGENSVLQVVTGDNPNTNGAYSYFAGMVTNTPVNGEALGTVNNIAFDYKGEMGAGAPRISLALSDGSYVYLSAYYSSAPLDDGWVQFNTDDRAGTQHAVGAGPAVIWDSLGHAYTTDGGGTAWAHMAVDHGVTTTIDGIWVVQDENHGIVQFDNLRFDTVMFVQGGTKGAYETLPPVA